MEINKIFENAAERNAFIQGGKAAIEEDGSIFDKAKAGGAEFVETLKENTEELGESLVNGIATEGNAFIQGGKAAIEEEGSILDKAKAGGAEFVETLKENTEELGESLIDGIKKGVVSSTLMTGEIVEFVKDKISDSESE